MKKSVSEMSKTELIEEYKLILLKTSKLSRTTRDLVESKIAHLHKNGKVTIQELKP